MLTGKNNQSHYLSLNQEIILRYEILRFHSGRTVDPFVMSRSLSDPFDELRINSVKEHTCPAKPWRRRIEP